MTFPGYLVQEATRGHITVAQEESDPDMGW